MRDWTDEAVGGGRHRRRRSAARITTVIIVVTVLSVLGIGYVRLAAHQQTAPPRPAGPGTTAANSPFTAEAAAAVARLQAKVGDAYTATHLWQAASALLASIGFMRATGSQAYLGRPERHLPGTSPRRHLPGQLLRRRRLVGADLDQGLRADRRPGLPAPGQVGLRRPDQGLDPGVRRRAAMGPPPAV